MTWCDDLQAEALAICAEFGRNSPECIASMDEYEFFCLGESAGPISDNRRAQWDLRKAGLFSGESAASFVKLIDSKYSA